MKKQGFIYGSVILAASAVITKLIGAFFRIPLASLLGGTGMGYFSCAYGIFLPVYAVTAAGLPAAAARLTARDIALNGGASSERIRKTGIYLFTAAGLAGMLIIMAAAPFFCKYITHNTAALPSIIMIAPAVLFGCPCAVLRGCREGGRNMYPTALSQIAEALVKAAAGLGGAYAAIKIMGGSPFSLSYASAAACGGVSLSVLAGLIFMIVYDKKTGTEKPPENSGKMITVKQTVKELAAVAVPGAVCALVTNITSLIDLVSIMNSLERAVERDGQYFSEYIAAMPVSEIPNFIYGSFAGLAVTVFNLVPSVTNMFGKGILPAASEAYGRKDGKALAKCAEDVVLAAAAVAVPCGIGISALSEPILMFLFSDSALEVKTAAPSLAVLGPGLILLCVSSAFFPVFQAADRPDIPVKLMAAGTAVKAAGNILLVPVPAFNISGAAAATDMCYAVICAAGLVLLKKKTGGGSAEMYIKLLKLLFAGILCGAAAAVTYGAMSKCAGNTLSTLFSVGAGGIIYIISTYFEGLFDKSTVKMLISKKIQKNT